MIIYILYRYFNFQRVTLLYKGLLDIFFIQLCEAEMIKYTCKSCNITTELSECPHCGERTEIVNSTIYWCKFCNIPTFDEHCPICGSKGKRIGSDIRPVFPQERLLLEILLDCPLKYKNSSVWNTAGNYYYADGEKLPFTASQTKDVDADYIRAQLW